MKKAESSAPVPGWSNLEAVFESLGRVLISLDDQFHVLRASHTLDALAGEGASTSVIGNPIESLIGARLFGPEDSLREALREGRREEGRRGVLRCGEDAARLVSVTAAPVAESVMRACATRGPVTSSSCVRPRTTTPCSRARLRRMASWPGRCP